MSEFREVWACTCVIICDWSLELGIGRGPRICLAHMWSRLLCSLCRWMRWRSLCRTMRAVCWAWMLPRCCQCLPGLHCRPSSTQPTPQMAPLVSFRSVLKQYETLVVSHFLLSRYLGHGGCEWKGVDRRQQEHGSPVSAVVKYLGGNAHGTWVGQEVAACERAAYGLREGCCGARRPLTAFERDKA